MVLPTNVCSQHTLFHASPHIPGHAQQAPHLAFPPVSSSTLIPTLTHAYPQTLSRTQPSGKTTDDIWRGLGMDLQGGGGGGWPATAGFTAAPEPRQRHDSVRLPACHIDLM